MTAPVSAVRATAGEYPAGGVALSNSSGNVANATALATLTPPAGKTAYLSGFVVSGAGATAAAIVSVTVTGVTGGTMTFTYVAAAGATLANTPLTVTFPRAIPATGPGVAIAVSCPALGAGNTNNAVVAFGYSA